MNEIATWQDSYSVGIKTFDEQHRKLIDMTNELYSSYFETETLSSFVFRDIIRLLVDYIKHHFSTEEKVMEKINYYKYREHKKEHVDFIKEVLAKVNDFHSGKTNTSLPFVRFLKDWILHHIAVCDKEMGSHVRIYIKNNELQNTVPK